MNIRSSRQKVVLVLAGIAAGSLIAYSVWDMLFHPLVAK